LQDNGIVFLTMHSSKRVWVFLLCSVLCTQKWWVHAQTNYCSGWSCHSSKSLKSDDKCECNRGHWPDTNAVVEISASTHPEVVTGKVA